MSAAPSQPSQAKLRLLMVCLGNICRSPTAHGVLQKMIEDKGLQGQLEVDSAGTGSYHAGEPPDPRTISAAAGRGYDLSSQRARQVTAVDFDAFDHVLAMDKHNLQELQRHCPTDKQHKLSLLLDYMDVEGDSRDGANGIHKRYDEVPDPYYGGADGFELVLDLVESACRGLLDAIDSGRLPPSRA